MALSDKNIVITPNIGSSTDDPKIVFSGANTSVSGQNITMRVYPTSNGTLSVEGTSGQLFSITNQLSGTIYSVNDVSGMPSIQVLDTGNVIIAPYTGNLIVNGVDVMPRIAAAFNQANTGGGFTAASALFYSGFVSSST